VVGEAGPSAVATFRLTANDTLSKIGSVLVPGAVGGEGIVAL
jgi:hypothetical protein